MNDREQFIESFLRVARPAIGNEAEAREHAGRIYDYCQRSDADLEVAVGIAEIAADMVTRRQR